MLRRTYQKRRLLSLILVIVTFLALTGCGTSTASSGTADSAKTPETRIVKHIMGESTVPTTPKRVVVLTNEGTEALLTLGIKPVGAVKSWTGNPWYEHIKNDMEGVQVVGDEGQPNLEAIAALKPDLILGNKMRQEKIYTQLSAIAPTVFTETLRGEWKNNFTVYADALNKSTEGQKVIGDFNKRIADFKKQAGDKLSTQVSIVRFMSGKTRIYYSQTFSGIILKELGFARPQSQTKDAFADDVTKERIPEMDGDILFYFTYETGNGDANKAEQEWTNDPLWKNLSVVKSNKTYKVDDDIWNTAGGVIAANLLLDDLGKFFLTK
ncbi:iron-siderophore ABC transporter substrate-binding protein [Desulfosporosinus fructosivorans]|uniref:Iron-siderophore ABC transporter substrate-binding protein n=1 Tax=Desulfosporosinus fructosivorans TaxID=2018669 RepID=A0A4Z0QZ93_9FIRM|nr:iron-siderophore ABC transporter substrate-binding protein [Desulfosporosinus fructosivorans]TGE35263.1 iron-siderophore ABC transporter substrate-binding protein [Desulfosporosinus fructosivorans]